MRGVAKHSVDTAQPSPGLAGVDNPVFYMDRTVMFFRDGKQAIIEILDEMKNLYPAAEKGPAVLTGDAFALY